MNKQQAQYIIDWWTNKYYYKDPSEDEPIWFMLIGNKVIEFTYGELLTIANQEE